MSITVDGVARFLTSAEARDKLMKFHQYQGRMWAYLLKDSNPLIAEKFEILFSKTRIKFREC